MNKQQVDLINQIMTCTEEELDMVIAMTKKIISEMDNKDEDDHIYKK